MNQRDMDAIKSVMIEQRDEKMDRLERQRDELLAALKNIKAHLDHGIHDADWQWGVEAYDIANAAIDRTEADK